MSEQESEAWSQDKKDEFKASYVAEYPEAVVDPTKAELMASASSEFESKIVQKKNNPDAEVLGLFDEPTTVEDLTDLAELYAKGAAGQYDRQQNPDKYKRLAKLENDIENEFGHLPIANHPEIHLMEPSENIDK